MKVIRPGVLHFEGGQAFVAGWHFDGEGGPYPTQGEVTRCAIDYIAEQLRLPPSPVVDAPVSLEVERMAAAALTKAAARAPARRWWQWRQR